jgi:hypothetical protein
VKQLLEYLEYQANLTDAHVVQDVLVVNAATPESPAINQAQVVASQTLTWRPPADDPRIWKVPQGSLARYYESQIVPFPKLHVTDRSKLNDTNCIQSNTPLTPHQIQAIDKAISQSIQMLIHTPCSQAPAEARRPIMATDVDLPVEQFIMESIDGNFDIGRCWSVLNTGAYVRLTCVFVTLTRSLDYLQQTNS